MCMPELVDVVHAIHPNLTPSMIRGEMTKHPQIKSTGIAKAEFIEAIDQWNEHFRKVKRDLIAAMMAKGSSSGARRASMAAVLTRSATRHGLTSKRAAPHATSTAVVPEDSSSFSKLRFRKAVRTVRVGAAVASGSHVRHALSGGLRSLQGLVRPPRTRSVVPAAAAVIVANHPHSRVIVDQRGAGQGASPHARAHVPADVA